jgi:MinD-like ATPase involved in chromosome partitioning or flagellar assembly
VSVPVLTAVADARVEADLCAELSRNDLGVQVVRRCVDLADLLSAAAAGLGRAVILSGDLRRLDREALSRLGLARVAVVGLVGPADEGSDRRLRQLGVGHVLTHDASSQAVSQAVHAAVSELVAIDPPVTTVDWADPLAGGGRRAGEAGPVTNGAAPSRASSALEAEPSDAGAGTVIAVWGPVGSPGRSTIAVNLAAELAGLGVPTLLIDADTYGGVIAQLLGLLDEAPGLAAACRAANQGGLDVAGLGDIALELRPTLRVLTGITRAERWPEIRPSALRTVLALARSVADVTVIDCGFCLEQDEELAYDTAAPRRNGATLAALEAADTVLAVAAADPVGIVRFVRALPDCVAIRAGRPPVTVVNRLRRGAGARRPHDELAAALERYAGITDPFVVPEDAATLDTAVAAGRTLAEIAAGSPARTAIRALAAHLAGIRDPGRGRSRRTERLSQRLR